MAKSGQLRISGLVKLARQVREELIVGIPLAEMEVFRDRIRRNIRKVEVICREHRVTPKDLPVPSYRAYRFLRDLDLDAIPEREGSVPESHKTIRISGIVAMQNEMNDRFAAWVAEVDTDDRMGEDHPRVRTFAKHLTLRVQRIGALARKEGAGPGQLPIRSRRAYQWLKLLSDPSTLIVHLETLRDLQGAFQVPRCRTQPSRRVRRAPVQIQFAYTSYLYSARIVDGALRVTIHEGFIGASAEVLRSLACAVLSENRGPYRAEVKAYSFREDFQEVVTALEMATVDTDDAPRGRCFDLEAVFDRVNAIYFDGRLPRLRLMWNRRNTQVKFGHYDALRDTVMVSVSLDAPEVPDYVLDFVMYHELLHKAMGMRVVNGRRYAHTTEFREAEQQFERYAEAKAFLEEVARADRG